MRDILLIGVISATSKPARDQDGITLPAITARPNRVHEDRHLHFYFSAGPTLTPFLTEDLPGGEVTPGDTRGTDLD